MNISTIFHVFVDFWLLALGCVYCYRWNASQVMTFLLDLTATDLHHFEGSQIMKKYQEKQSSNVLSCISLHFGPFDRNICSAYHLSDPLIPRPVQHHICISIILTNCCYWWPL